ncbi:MAG TPA: hypothetical protein VFW85_05440 [Gaiellaceae bacterium]|nr:hypothetical protein [Gaiellaceae bacterium]
MRRLALIFVLAAVAVPAAAVAADRSAGDGAFELRAANGTVTLNGRGVMWGQLDSGSLRVTDPVNSLSPQLLVSGAEHTRPVGENVTVYWGANLTFRITGGKYRIRFKGSGLDLTAIGTGTADMTGDPTTFTDGSFALDSGKWQPVPLLEKVVTYGLPTPTTTGSQTGP